MKCEKTEAKDNVAENQWHFKKCPQLFTEKLGKIGIYWKNKADFQKKSTP